MLAFAVLPLYAWGFSGFQHSVSDSSANSGDSLETATPGLEQDSVSSTISASDTVAATETPLIPPDTSAVPRDTVHFWRFHQPVAADLLVSDSTMRWQYYLSAADRLAERSGAIGYRLGTEGRWDGVQLETWQPREMKAYWHGIAMDNGLNGMMPWFDIPEQRAATVYEARKAGSYELRYEPMLFYLRKPQTRFAYDESKNGLRNLNFFVTQNVLPRHNVQLGYQDKTAGSAYQRSGVEGRQFYVHTAHHLGEKYQIRTGVLNTNLEIDESFGYQVPDINTFSFYAPEVLPNNGSASSKWNRNLIFAGIFRRTAEENPQRSGLQLYRLKDERNLKTLADTLGYSREKIGLQASHRFRFLNMDGEIRLPVSYTGLSGKTGYQIENWLATQPELALAKSISPKFSLNGDATMHVRGDVNEPGWEGNLRLNYKLNESWKFSLKGGTASQIPPIQHLYHESAGQQNFENQALYYGSGEVRWLSKEWLTISARASIKQRQNQTALAGDSAYIQLPTHHTYSGILETAVDLRHWEGKLSATVYERWADEVTDARFQNFALGDPAILFKGKLFWKRYFFDKATYAKVGLGGQASPVYYQTAAYSPVFNEWSYLSQNRLNRPFYRLDVMVHARIRAIMLHVDWQNVLSDLPGGGYFESVPYPMPGRRLVVGLRVIFNN